MRDEKGQLGPAANKFQSTLMDIKGNMQKGGSVNAQAYINAYNAADEFMQESLGSKNGPEKDAARQMGRNVRKRLKENDRIDKMKNIAEYEKKKEMLREKAGKINERKEAQATRDRKIDKLKNNMRTARAERDKVNTENYKENKRKLEESGKKLEEARKRREAAVKRTAKAQRHSQKQVQQPQKRAMGM